MPLLSPWLLHYWCQLSYLKDPFDVMLANLTILDSFVIIMLNIIANQLIKVLPYICFQQN